MTPELLSSFCAVLLSLAASYVPGFSVWYASLDGSRKRLVMLGLLAGISAGVYGLACLGMAEALGLPLACDQPGGLALMRAFLAALISNQAAFAISPRGKLRWKPGNARLEMFQKPLRPQKKENPPWIMRSRYCARRSSRFHDW